MRHLPALTIWLTIGLAIASALGCDDGPLVEDAGPIAASDAGVFDAGAGGPADAGRTPRRDASSPDAGASTTEPRYLDRDPASLPTRAHRVVYLNFVGGVFRRGSAGLAHANQSATGYEGADEYVVVPPFRAQRFFEGLTGPLRAREEVIARIVARVRELYADVDLQLTTTRPTDAAFSMVVIGGRDTDWYPGALGVTASGACADADIEPNGVAHVFSLSFETGWPGHRYEAVALTAIHEIGHMMGLRHNQNPLSIMAAPHGNQWTEGLPVEGWCARATQDDFAVLMTNLGSPIPRGPIAPSAVDPDAPDVVVKRVGSVWTVRATDASPIRYLSLRVFYDDPVLPLEFNAPSLLHEELTFDDATTIDVSTFPAGAVLEILVPDRWDNTAVLELSL